MQLVINILYVLLLVVVTIVTNTSNIHVHANKMAPIPSEDITMKMSTNNNRSIISGVDSIPTTSFKGSMKYYGFFGNPTTWSEAYAHYEGKQLAGWDFSEEDIPLGSIVTFFGGVGETVFSATPYFRMTVRINAFADTKGEGNTATDLNFMYLGWPGIGKLEASSNVEMMYVCRYGESSETSVEMWIGDTRVLSKSQNDLEFCDGVRPPKT